MSSRERRIAKARKSENTKEDRKENHGDTKIHEGARRSSREAFARKNETERKSEDRPSPCLSPSLLRANASRDDLRAPSWIFVSPWFSFLSSFAFSLFRAFAIVPPPSLR